MKDWMKRIGKSLAVIASAGLLSSSANALEVEVIDGELLRFRGACTGSWTKIRGELSNGEAERFAKAESARLIMAAIVGAELGPIGAAVAGFAIADVQAQVKRKNRGKGVYITFETQGACHDLSVRGR